MIKCIMNKVTHHLFDGGYIVIMTYVSTMTAVYWTLNIDYREQIYTMRYII